MPRSILSVVLSVWLAIPSLAWPCNTRPLETIDPTREEQYGTTGLTILFYDRDGDGSDDRALLFQADPDGMITTWPLLYFEDLAPDGRAEEVWIDRFGDGFCQDIVLYWKRTVSFTR